MTCEEIHPLLADYLEGRLEPKVLSAVKTHLRQCKDCQEELQAEQAMMQWLGSRDTVPVSAEFTYKLLGRLGVATSKPPRWFENFLELSNYWAPSLAAVLVLIFAGRTILDWISRARSLGQQAVGVIDNLPTDISTAPISHYLPDSLTSSDLIATLPLWTLLVVLGVGGLAFGLLRIFRN